MRKFTSYVIDGNIITAFIIIPSVLRGYENWHFHELILWYALLALIIYVRQKTRHFFVGS